MNNQIDILNKDEIFGHILHVVNCVGDSGSKYLSSLYGEMESIKFIDPIIMFYTIQVMKSEEQPLALNLIYETNSIKYIIYHETPTNNCFVINQDVFFNNVSKIKLQKKGLERVSFCIKVMHIDDLEKFNSINIGELLQIVQHNFKLQRIVKLI